MNDLTFNELGDEMMRRLEALLDKPFGGEVKRDVALSRTHLEDALTRFNSAQYRISGRWNRNDPELDELVS